MNIASNLKRAAFYFPDRIAVIDGDRQISYREFDRESNRVAAGLAQSGVRPGDHVALCAPNSYRWLNVYFGALKAGAVAVTCSHLLSNQELTGILNDCQPRAVFASDERLADLGDRKDRPYLKSVVCDHGDVSYSELAGKTSDDFALIDRSRAETAAILYTGGTTGIPKGALLSHENLAAAIHNVAFYERSTEHDRALCFLPLNHVFAQIHIMNSTVYSAGGLVIQPAFDMEKVMDAIQRHRVTRFYGVPTIYVRLLQLDALREKLDSIRYCFSAAASMATETVRTWKARTGLNIHEAYGMTESASMVTYNHYYRHVVGSVGTPANLVEIQIRDLDGNPLETGKHGEICICGPNITRGYLNHPAETEAAFWGRWFRSGDIGMIDADGYLYIVDRLKDMIITGGENVYPREVEEVLYAHSDILECAVVGLPDREYGERVTAFVVPQQGRNPESSELKSFLKKRLAGFKVPKEYIVVNELPKNNAGKLLKREIKRQWGGKQSGQDDLA
jgi:long-chain acyl-CoA synthetase